MKFIYLSLLSLISFCNPLFLSISAQDKIIFLFDNEDKYLGNRQRIANKILQDTSIFVQNKYKILTVGTSMALTGNEPQQLGLSFDSYELSKEELRKNALEIAIKLLENINSNVDFQPFMTKKPFTVENIDISIFNHNPNGNHCYDPQIGIIDFSNGILRYKTYSPDKKFGYKNELEETYEEALQIVQRENQNQNEKNMAK